MTIFASLWFRSTPPFINIYAERCRLETLGWRRWKLTDYNKACTTFDVKPEVKNTKLLQNLDRKIKKTVLKDPRHPTVSTFYDIASQHGYFKALYVTIYIAKFKCPSLWRNGCSFELQIQRSRVRIAKGPFFFKKERLF